MKWDATWILFAFTLLHALAGLLLIAVDVFRAPPAPAATRRAFSRRRAVGRPPRPRAERRLHDSLRRWRTREGRGKGLPDAAGRCRSGTGRSLDRSVA